MNNFFRSSIALAAVLAVSVATPASAGQIADGTVSIANLYTPTINLVSTPATFSVTLGQTVELTASGGFLGAQGKSGIVDGTLSFSNIVGDTLTQALDSFFVFDDGAGGTFNFSVSSVTTQTYANMPGVSSSIALYVLGTTVDTNLDDSATPTSLTISFQNTGNSPYSSSATLAVPPATTVPEPATLAMLGMGLFGLGVIRRIKKV